METNPQPASKAMFWAGWIMSVLPALAFLASGIMKFVKPGDMVQQSAANGWGEHLLVPLGAVEIACALIYLFPKTAVLGAILLTGYCGGAIASHVRLDQSFAPALILGILVWGGLYLRDARVRALIPLKS